MASILNPIWLQEILFKKNNIFLKNFNEISLLPKKKKPPTKDIHLDELDLRSIYFVAQNKTYKTCERLINPKQKLKNTIKGERPMQFTSTSHPAHEAHLRQNARSDSLVSLSLFIPKSIHSTFLFACWVLGFNQLI